MVTEGLIVCVCVCVCVGVGVQERYTRVKYP